MNKNDKRPRRPLSLRKDTLRTLTPIDAAGLADVAGGRGAPRTGFCTKNPPVSEFCP